MNLADIRAAIYAQADWEPSPSDAENTRVNEFINRAQDQLALEAPFLFYESEVRFATQADVIGSDDDLVTFVSTDTTPNAPVNPWLLRQVLPTTDSDAEDWPIDRTWDGRTLEIIDTDGTVYRNRIRTVWEEASGGIVYRFISLWRPWPTDIRGTPGTTQYKYRIYTEHYYLPDDVIQFKSARLFEESYNWPLTILGQDEAEKRSLADRRTAIAAGQPRAMFRRGHFKLDGPRVAPAAALGNATAAQGWLGPDPPGKFSYRITYTWGKRDDEFRNVSPGHWDDGANQWTDPDPFHSSVDRRDWSRDRFKEPLWESAPSPISAEVTAVAPGDLGAGPIYGQGVVLTLPNIEYMQGFFLIGTEAGTPGSYLRAHNFRSGWHVRIYRRRHTEAIDADYHNLGHTGGQGTGQDVDTLQKLDIPDQYFLLAELRLDDINQGRFVDSGEILPDYHRPLREVHGYQAVQMYPKPDKRYEVDIRCVRRPEKLVSDADVPRVHPEAIDVIIHRALVLFYEHEGNHEKAGIAMSRFDRNLRALTKRYSDMRPPQEPYQRQFTRARRGTGNKGGVRRWWKTDV